MVVAFQSKHIAYELLARVHPDEAAQDLFRDKVQRRPLNLNPTTGGDENTVDARTRRQTARAEKAASRRRSHKPQPLSAKQKRALCVYDIPKAQRKYDIYAPLYRMWVAYIREILGLDGSTFSYVVPKSAGPLLASADYHGAILEVVRSRCASRVGLRGIVVKDTKFTFELITVENLIKVVPKEHTVFRFEIPFGSTSETVTLAEEPAAATPRDGDARTFKIEIHGETFMNRAPDRATKKLKLHLPRDL